MINEIVKQYKKYCDNKGWTQQEAAVAIGCG